MKPTISEQITAIKRAREVFISHSHSSDKEEVESALREAINTLDQLRARVAKD